MKGRNLLAELQGVASRFAGVDIQYRRFTPVEWAREALGKPYAHSIDMESGVIEDGYAHGHWRLKLCTDKGARANYRLVVYGGTFEEAATALLRQVADIDNDVAEFARRYAEGERP